MLSCLEWEGRGGMIDYVQRGAGAVQDPGILHTQGDPYDNSAVELETFCC